MKKDRPLNVKAFAIGVLRRGSYKWPPRWKVLKAASVGRNQYRCNICKGIYPRKKVQLDHITPVIHPTRGWINFDDYINRLYVMEDGFQVLCKNCHSLKSGKENKVRKLTKKKMEKQ